MKNILYALAIVCLLGSMAKAQNTTGRHADKTYLEIGDTIPDLYIRKIRNYKESSLQFSSLKNKLVILDFWFGTCKACIETFPKLEALQKKFGEQLQIIMVNFESQQTIDSIFSKWRRVSYMYRNPTLPSITADTMLHQLFAVKYYPHEVWIDGNGVVKAFTSSGEVSENNIAAILAKQKVDMAIKKDNLQYDDFKKPILPQAYETNAANLKFYSILLNYIPGVSGGLMRSAVDSVSGTVRVSRRNMSILELFGNALDSGMGGNPFRSPHFDFGKRVQLEISDSSRYFYLPSSTLTKEQWKQENSYSYEAIVPLEQQDLIFNYMLQDLERFFNITYRVKKQKLPALALVRINGIDKIKSKRKASISFFERDTTKFELGAGFLSSLIDKLSAIYKDSPWVFVDKTNYNGRIDLSLDNAILGNLQALRKELRKTYGLDLVETQEIVEVTALSETKPAVVAYNTRPK